MHELTFDDPVIGFLSKLPKTLRTRIFNKIISTKENPHRYFDRLSGRKDYRLGVGDYRVIADIDSNSIKVTLIEHRARVYKK